MVLVVTSDVTDALVHLTVPGPADVRRDAHAGQEYRRKLRQDYLEAEVEQMREWRQAATTNRRVLSLINEFTLLANV